MNADQIVADRMTDLAAATTNEQEVAINQAAIRQLEEMNTPASREAATKIRNQGLNYNMNLFGELQDRQATGEVFTNEELAGMVQRQDISLAEAQALGYDKDGAQSAQEAALGSLKPFEAEIKGVSKGIIAQIIATEVDDPDRRAEILAGEGKIITGDMTERLTASMAEWVRFNPGASSAEIRQELTRQAQEMRNEANANISWKTMASSLATRWAVLCRPSNPSSVSLLTA